MQKNIVNFIGCDAEYEEADVVLFGALLILPHHSGREPGLPGRPYEMTLTGWKSTVRIRTVS